MGGIVSNPLDDAKRQEIQDTVEEVMGVFSKEFAMGYVRDDALRALVTPALVNELAKIDAAA